MNIIEVKAAVKAQYHELLSKYLKTHDFYVTKLTPEGPKLVKSDDYDIIFNAIDYALQAVHGKPFFSATCLKVYVEKATIAIDPTFEYQLCIEINNRSAGPLPAWLKKK